MLIVTKSIFAGRSNPTGTIDGLAAQRILRPISENQDGITTIMQKRKAGLTPLIVENDNQPNPYGLPAVFFVDDGYAKDVALGAEYARRILDEVTLLKPTNLGKPRTYYTSDGSNRDNLGPYTRTDWTNAGQVAVQLADFSPDYWNSSTKLTIGNNCFAYATNINTGWNGVGRSQVNWLHPGYCKTQTVPSGNAEFAAAIHGDAIYVTDSPDNKIKGTSDDPAWIVAVTTGHPVSDPEHEWDCHLYRKVWHPDLREYVWGHKPGAHPVEYIRDNVADAPLEDAKKRGYDGRYGRGYCTIYHNRLCCGSEL